MDPDSAHKLRFRILDCTSEDHQFPVSELLVSSQQPKGWQSQRFCAFPQQITIQFLSPVVLRQLQFLIHETKIASKIELQVALPDLKYPIPHSQVQFKKIGYLPLDPNEKSNFKLRELKTVHLEVQCTYLRLILHKCHLNKHNFFNQVGLVSIVPYGDIIDLSALKQIQQMESPTGVPSHKQKGEQQEVFLDEMTRARIAELEEAKQRAVEEENFEEAEMIRQEIARYQQYGGRLAKLEEKKAIAIMNEDYETAQFCKREMAKIRDMLSGQARKEQKQREYQQQQREYQQQEAESLRNSGRMSEIGAEKETSRGQKVRGGYNYEEADEMNEEMREYAEEEDVEEEDEVDYGRDRRGERMETQGSTNLHKRHSAKEVNSHDEMVIPALKKKNPGEGGAEENMDEQMQGQAPVHEAEELSPANQKLAEPFLPVIGEDLCKKMFSKHWNLREEVVKVLISEVPKEGSSGVINYKNPWEGFVAIMGVLSFLLVDKVNQVSTKAINLMMVLMGKKPNNVGARNELINYIDMTLGTLLEKIGDTNQRVREQAEEAIMSMVRNPVITCGFCLSVILKDMVPLKGNKVLSAKHILGRLRVVQRVVKEYKIDNNDVPYLPVVDFAVEKLENASSEVRSAAVNLLVDVYRLVGDRLNGDLDGIRPAHLEMLQKAFGINVEKKGKDEGKEQGNKVRGSLREKIGK